MDGRRICVVVHYEGVSGAARSLPDRLGELRDATIEFLVPGPGPAERGLAPLGQVHQLRFSALTFPGGSTAAPSHLLNLVGQVRLFREHFRRTRPDLIVVTSMMVPTATLAARLERIPALVHASELLNAERLPSATKRAVARGLMAGTSAWATMAVACSDLAGAQLDRSRLRVETLYPPISDPGEEGDRDGFRRDHGIQPGDVCVAMAGNVTRGRGQDLLLRAMPLVRARVPQARCLIAGEPFERERDLAYRERLTNLCGELEIEQAVDFVGVVDRVADFYAAADVVVNPARIPESFGRVACEALAAGRPVVATRVGAVPEVLRHRRTALLVEPDAPDEFAAAVIELIENRRLATELVEAGREDVLRRFAPDLVAARFRRLAEETLTGERIPDTAESAQPAAGSPHPAEAPF